MSKTTSLRIANLAFCPGDDRRRRQHLRVTGTLGVLRAGAEQGLVNVPALIGRLKTTSFYVDDALVNAIFQRWLGP